MNWDRSIRSKLIAIMLVLSMGALSAGMFVVGVSYYNSTKQAMIADAKTQAELLAENAKGVVSFAGFEDQVHNLLRSVRLDSQFAAAIFDFKGTILATTDDTDGAFYISDTEFKDHNEVVWRDDQLHVWQIIEADGEFLGTVYLKISTAGFDAKINRMLLLNLSIFAVLLLITYWVADRLQLQVSKPLMQLEEFSREVAKTGNYSIRAPVTSEDEVGSLARSFNHMLETIEHKQRENEAANEALQVNKKRLERAVKDLQYLANYDALTQLPNRALCMDRIKYALKRATRTNSLVAVLFLDLDHFKDVNGSLGHAVGDQLLKATSQRLLEKIRSEDTLARLGGDEFVIILNEVRDTESVINIVEKIVASFNDPFKLSEFEVNTTVSIGICMFPNDGADVDSLMKNADAAMYKAKELGRNTYEFFEQELNQLATRRHQLANELRQAITNQELHLVFQPQLELESNKICGAEVLLRWTHPTMGPISPGEFIPIAENTGLIRDIGQWVLDTACVQLHAFRAEGLDVRLAVNLSALQFRQGNLPEVIAATLQRYRIPPRNLELEITESMLMRDVNQAIDILQRLKDMKIRIAIDDFGTGYSSLSYLRRFPVDALKVDRSFVDELVVDPDDTAITLAVISMAKSLRLDVVAEGVETKQQLEFLRRNDCDQAQGYYIARPMKAAEFRDFLERYQDGVDDSQMSAS